MILGHRDFPILKKMIDFFDDNFILYIHIDKKSSISEDDLFNIKQTKNVSFLSREYTINWGGHNMLKAILMLAEEAIKNRDIDYIHLISGQDFPIKNCEHIQKTMQKNKGLEFINYFNLPAPFWTDNGGFDRISYYHYYDKLNARTYFGRKTINFLVKLQKLMRIKRNIKQSTSEFYGGSSWWSLSYACLSHVIDFTKNRPDYVKQFEHSFAAEEIFFQTIIMNSSFKNKVVNNNLRYVDWQRRNGSRPAVLDISDYDKLRNSDAIFARKFQDPISRTLIEKIEQGIIKEETKSSQRSYVISSREDLPALQ